MKKSLIRGKGIALLIMMLMLTGTIQVVGPVYAETEEGFYTICDENFENYTGESDVFTYTYAPQAEAAAAGRTGTASVEMESPDDRALKVVSMTTSAESSTGSKYDRLILSIADMPNESGVIGISFDARVENGHARPFYRFGQLKGSDTAGAVMQSLGKYYLQMKGDSGNKDCYLDSNKEYHFEYRLDLNNDTCSVTASVNNSANPNPRTVTKPLGDYMNSDGTIELHFTTYFNNISGWTEGDTGIVWYDNIKAYAYQAQVKTTTPAKDASNVEVENGVTFTLSAPIKNLDSTKIRLYANKNEVTAFDASLSSDGKTITVMPPDGLQYNTEYEIALESGYAQPKEIHHQKPQTYTLKFTTKSLITPMENWKESAVFGEGFIPALTAPTGVNYAVTLAKDGAESQAYIIGTPINQAGSYVMSVIATDSMSDKTQSQTYEFTIVPPSAPVANDVHIECDTVVATDSILKGCYKYESYGDIPEGTSLFRWFKGASENGPWSLTEVTTQNYTLLPTDENSWFRFEVRPYAQEEPSEGEVVLSEPFMGAMSPVATNVSISQEGNVLTGNYLFADSNDDGEDKAKTEFRWYKKNRISGAISEISGVTSQTYELQQTDIDDYIFFGVKPFSLVKPCEGEEVTSELMLLPCRPEASNVSISGTEMVGNTISAYYTFYDVNGDQESDSICTWYIDGSPLHKGPTLELMDYMAGKEIYFEIIPSADVFPQEGAPVRSDTIIVSDRRKSSGGSGTSSMKVSIVIKEEPKKEVSPDLSVENTDNIQGTVTNGFADTVNHWAKNEIDSMQKRGIINGFSSTEFRPDAFVSRAETAKLFAKAFDLSISEKYTFADVRAEDWFADFVAAVAEAGFMNGDGESFYPHRTLVREEICVLLANIAQKYGLQAETTAGEFTDVDEISDWASEAVKTVVSLGLMNGVGDGQFAPKQETTRAEIAVILYRTLERLGL